MNLKLRLLVHRFRKEAVQEPPKGGFLVGIKNLYNTAQELPIVVCRSASWYGRSPPSKDKPKTPNVREFNGYILAQRVPVSSHMHHISKTSVRVYYFVHRATG